MADAALRSNLIRAIEQGADNTKIVQLCDRLLHAKKDDTVGLRCKAVALLRAKRFPQAAAVAAELAASSAAADDKKGAAGGRFLGAMCEYRQGKFEAAAQTLLGKPRTTKTAATAAGDDAATAEHNYDYDTTICNAPTTSCFGAQEWNLLAQSLYNMHKYRSAAAIYDEQLLKPQRYLDEVERMELLTNLSACYASEAEIDKCASAMRTADEQHHDLLFNYATALAQSGKFAEAAKTLADAERICIYANELNPDQADFCAPLSSASSSTNDSNNNNNKNSQSNNNTGAFIKDVVAIKVQQAFVMHHLGDRSGAEKILHAVLQTHSATLIGTAAHAAACLNWTALKRHSDFLDSHKRLKHLQTPMFAKRLTTVQKECAAYNGFLLALGMDNKISQARAMAEAMCRDYPSGTLGPRALAAVLASSDPKRAEATLRKLLQSTTTSSNKSSNNASSSSSSQDGKIHQCLAMAQLALERGDVAGALDVASKSPEAMAQPAVLTTVLAGYASQGDAAQVEKLLTSKPGAELLKSKPQFAFQVAMHVYSRMGRHTDAAKLLESIGSGSGSGSGNDTNKSMWLAAAVLEFTRAHDVQNASRIASSSAFSAAGGAAGQQQVALQSTAVNLAQSESTALQRDKLAAAGYVKAASLLDQQQRKSELAARKRPMRRPAKDMSGKIDPERWIPMNLRTYIKDMPPRRRLEAKRKRADEAAEKRKAFEKRQKEAAAAAATASSSAAASSGEEQKK